MLIIEAVYSGHCMYKLHFQFKKKKKKECHIIDPHTYSEWDFYFWNPTAALKRLMRIK